MNPETALEIFKLGFKEPLKINKEAKEALPKLAETMIDELLEQLKDQQEKEGDISIRVEHLEKIAARFLLNF